MKQKGIGNLQIFVCVFGPYIRALPILGPYIYGLFKRFLKAYVFILLKV